MQEQANQGVLERASEQVGDISKTDNREREKNEPNQCKPCEPYPVGTIGYIGPKKSHYGIHGTQTGTGEEHYILYRVGQKSPQLGCQCYWQEDKKIAGHHYMQQPNIFMTINLNHKIIGNTRTKFLSYP